jgi:hypothetical protein
VRFFAGILTLLAVAVPATLRADVIDFEEFPDGSAIPNGTVLTTDFQPCSNNECTGNPSSNASLATLVDEINLKRNPRFT